MEERMTVSNMSIEAGARAGMIAADAKTVEYLRGRRFVADGRGLRSGGRAWLKFRTDDGATIRQEHHVRRGGVRAAGYLGNKSRAWWSRSPARFPTRPSLKSPAERQAVERALEYMGLQPGTAIEDIRVDRVFIGSCTNSRIGDLRAAADIVRGRKVAKSVHAMVVPGSQQVKAEAEKLGLDRIFMDAGFEWRESGCSMCLGMNPDILKPGERCASTSNRNFEGRQGKGGRTHLVSPVMAAAAAVSRALRGRARVAGALAASL